MKIKEATEYDVQVSLAEELLEREDYSGAFVEAAKVLDQLEPHVDTTAQAALTIGKALMAQAARNMAKGTLPSTDVFDKAWKAFHLSKKLNPNCQESATEIHKMSHMYKEMAKHFPPKPNELEADVDVLVVGAGPAGIGCALMLTQTFGLALSRVLLVERGDEVGETFRRWPEEMRFISPSFNQQGWTQSFDLNSISYGTSPAFSLHSEHPSGHEYAAYLEAMVKNYKLNVRRQTEVLSVASVSTKKDNPLFSVEIRSTADPTEEENSGPSIAHKPETLKARYIVWAAGEFQYPRGVVSTGGRKEEEKKNDGEEEKESREDTTLRGSELCLHNSKVRSWAELQGDDFIIIGGYESGVDAAVNLAKAGKKCTVLASTRCWRVKNADPSVELAPYTANRLRDVMAPDFSPNPRLFAPIRALRVDKSQTTGGFIVSAEWKPVEKEKDAPLRSYMNAVPTEEPGEEGSILALHTRHPPILCTGFEGSAAASNLFKLADKDDTKKGCLDGAPLLTKNDESTKVPGVFLVGPTVSHGHHSFCFIYKFRQRFAIVADAICQGLRIDTRAAVAECRRNNMYLDNFTCCGDTCGDVC